MDKIKLLGVVIIKYLYFSISFIIVWFLLLFDFLFYLLTLKKLEINLTELFSNFSIKVLRKILLLEFNINYKAENIKTR